MADSERLNDAAWGMGLHGAKLSPVQTYGAASAMVRGRFPMAASGGGSFTDPENARTIYLAAGTLLVVAVVLAIATVVWWRKGTTEHPALGPLEAMGARGWWRADYTERRRRLETARPEGAEGVASTAAANASEPVDLHALAHSGPTDYDDLLDDDARALRAAHAAEVAAEAEAAVDAAVLAETAKAAHLAHEAEGLAALAAAAAVVEATRHDGIEVPDPSPSSGVPIDPLLRVPTAE